MEIVIEGDIYPVTEETSQRVYYKDALEAVRFVERSDTHWRYAERRVLRVYSEGGYHGEIGDALPSGENLFEIPAGMTDAQAIALFDRYADGLGACQCGMPVKYHMGLPRVIEVKPITRIGVKHGNEDQYRRDERSRG